MNDQKIKNIVSILKPILKKEITSTRKECDQRLFDRFKKILSFENIDHLTEQNFIDFTSFKLNEHWTGIHRQNGEILKDLKLLRKNLKNLLDESKPILERYEKSRHGELQITGLGSSVLTAILTTVYPDKYCVLNKKVNEAFERLDLLNKNTKFENDAEKYLYVNTICTKLKEALGCTFLDLDYCWHLIRETELSQSEKSILHINENTTHFHGLKFETFEILNHFKMNPTKATYNEKKDEFKKFVQEPLQHLFHDLAPAIENITGTALQTKKNLISRIIKNDYGKGGIYDYLWGAFSDIEGKRQTSCQLYIIFRDHHVRFGLGWGSGADEYRQRLISSKQLTTIFNTDYIKLLEESDLKLKLASQDDIASISTLESPFHFIDKLKNSDDFVSLEVSIPASEAIALGAGLRIKIENTFMLLMPIMLISTFPSPEPYMNKWLSLHEDSDDDDNNFDTSKDSLYNWENFFAKMNWNQSSQEAKSIFRMTHNEDDDQNKKQIIFYGAPGTGKTKAAMELAKVLATDQDCIAKVQFHQSYGYENFIEGIRPVSIKGVLSYENEFGVFVKFCHKALKNPKNNFVFIIDEINRGNLSRIFGELMFLLEYRNEKLPLLYSHTLFWIPENVTIIGTMNSADRSIALVDYALRRRFSFVEFLPRLEVLENWYHHNKKSEHLTCLNLFAKINDMISKIDKRLAIGHSYLMIDEMIETGLTKSVFENIWEQNIYPLLEEYFCNLPHKLSEFNFAKLWNEVSYQTVEIKEVA